MIEAKHIEQAFQRFEDFANVQYSADPEIGVERMLEITQERLTDPEQQARAAGRQAPATSDSRLVSATKRPQRSGGSWRRC